MSTSDTLQNGHFLLALEASPRFYLCEIRGAVFLTWTTEKEHAMKFTLEQVYKSQDVVEQMAGEKTSVVYIFPTNPTLYARYSPSPS